MKIKTKNLGEKVKMKNERMKKVITILMVWLILVWLSWVFNIKDAEASIVTAKIEQQRDKIYLKILDKNFERTLENAFGSFGLLPFSPPCKKQQYYVCDQPIGIGIIAQLDENYQKIILKFNNLLNISEISKDKLKLETISFDSNGDVLSGKVTYSSDIPVYIGDLLTTKYVFYGYVPPKNMYEAIGYNFKIDLKTRNVSIDDGGVGVRYIFHTTKKTFYSFFSGSGNVLVEFSVGKGMFTGRESVISANLGSFDVFAISEEDIKSKVGKEKIKPIDSVKIFCGKQIGFENFDKILQKDFLEAMKQLPEECTMVTKHPCFVYGPLKFVLKDKVGILEKEERIDVCNKILYDKEERQFELTGKIDKETAMAMIDDKLYINPTKNPDFKIVQLKGEKKITKQGDNNFVKDGNVNMCIPAISVRGAHCFLALTAISATPQDMEKAIENVKANIKPSQKLIGGKRWSMWEAKEGNFGMNVFETKGKKVTSLSYTPNQQQVLVFYDTNSDGKPDIGLVAEQSEIQNTNEKVLRGEEIKENTFEPNEEDFDSVLSIFLPKSPDAYWIQKKYERYREERGVGAGRTETEVTETEVTTQIKR